EHSGRVRPKSQLVLPDAALQKPSAVPEFLTELKKNSAVSGYHFVPSREAQRVDLPQQLSPELRSVLAQRGIHQLYSHQARAFALADAGRNVAVVTPTASGKTLCYNLPVLNRIAANLDARALYLYPTKALTYDQLDDL